ncbi:MAG: adenylate/guanylate cyclase domain-containing protein [Gammaproteobacteria bacterium]|nr:adenylate/guanylate cyclase domain-containing protein [Gammaproteobacteria bacterium]
MEKDYAIMFADVAGSTSIYESMGNEIAERLIGNCVQGMIDITRKNNGHVIKTIGDEVMSSFPTADDAANAAIEIQKKTEIADSETGRKLEIRIGMHFGTAIMKDNDLFGDSVNTAARMGGIAKAGQIITTEYLVSTLDEKKKAAARLFDTAKVKGKEEELKIFQIDWEEEGNVTKFASSDDISKITNAKGTILLKFAGEERFYTDSDFKSPVVIGRDASCNIAINAGYASRAHVNLEYRRGKFVLVDHSTNGTYVQFKGQDEIFIRREELPLLGDGVFNLGEVISEETPGQISFTILQT